MSYELDAAPLIEDALRRALDAAQLGIPGARSGPPRLFDALEHAVFSGGARVRPQLCLAVAGALVDDESPGLHAGAHALAAGVAIELMHCASLAHDDLPCFDDADQRRGQPSVHLAFGEPLAVLAGDAMIVMAFQVIRDACRAYPDKYMSLSDVLIRGVGAPGGIIAGQAWESEDSLDLRAYHRSKTGALFVAACEAGAIAAGAPPDAWRALGLRLGEAYQIADDIKDVLCSSQILGKPTGVDADLERPNAVAFLGVDGALDQLNCLIEDAVEAIPPCLRADDLRRLVRKQKERLSAALEASDVDARRT